MSKTPLPLLNGRRQRADTKRKIVSQNNEQNAEYASILLFVKNMIHRYQRNGATCLRRFNTLRQWLSLSGCNIASEVSPSHSMTQTPPVLSHEAREALGITPDETCSVCLETFTQPCLLPCNHFLCYSCVLSIHNHARGRRDHRCPLCRNNYSLQLARRRLLKRPKKSTGFETVF